MRTPCAGFVGDDCALVLTDPLTREGFSIFDRAIMELKTCLVAAPYRAESWQMMSELLRRIGRPNEAAIVLAAAGADDVHLHEH